MRLKSNDIFYHISVSILICLAVIITAEKGFGTEGELSLYNPSGKATAYITEDLTVYLWSGEPVAYLSEDADSGFHVFGFNGKHLGWFVDGAVWDHSGKAVGGLAEVFRTPVAPAPFKDYRDYKPFKDFKEVAPSRPRFRRVWSNIPFKRFLLRGVPE